MNLTRREFALLATKAAALHSLVGFGSRSLAATASSPAAASATTELTALTISEAAARIRAGAVTATQLTEACLARIAVYDPMLDAFITVMKGQALAQARQLDAEQKAGRLRGPLHGIPIALKDNIDTAGTKTTAASELFAERIPDEDAPVVTRLVAAGAIIIGKTNLHEFAMGAGEESFYGPARNPWGLAHNPGGSSSGSGAAVSAELCFGALGTDTAGSIRHPAAYCSLVGLKPTFGLVPIRGIAPLTVCLDHCGPMTRTVEDNALMLDVLAGYDRLDITSVEYPKTSYTAALRQPVNGFRLGTPDGPYTEGLHPEVVAATAAALDVLRGLTSGTKTVTLPSTTAYTIATLGYAGETYAYHEAYFKKSPEKYQAPNRRRLETASANEGKAAAYIRTKWDLDLMRRTIDDSFQEVDLLVMPTMKGLPPLTNDLLKRNRDALVAKPADPAAPAPRRPGISNCAPFNAMGLPALSLPCGFSESGLPIGLMIVGPRFSEGKIFALAHAYEQATAWHTRKPPLTPATPVPALITS